MIEIDATLIKDKQSIQAYFKQVQEHTQQIKDNIKYADFKTLQLDEALDDILYKADEIIKELDN